MLCQRVYKIYKNILFYEFTIKINIFICNYCRIQYNHIVVLNTFHFAIFNTQ